MGPGSDRVPAPPCRPPSLGKLCLLLHPVQDSTLCRLGGRGGISGGHGGQPLRPTKAGHCLCFCSPQFRRRAPLSCRT